MAKSNSKPQRIDPVFLKEMKELAKFRYFKNLANKEPSMREMTHLLRRTAGWQTAKQELKIKPKRKDNANKNMF